MAGLGKFLMEDGGVMGLLNLKTAFFLMETGEYLPSMIIGKITDEAVKIAGKMKKMEGKKDVEGWLGRWAR